MRRKIIAGNWKMYKTGPEAVALAKSLKLKLVNVTEVDVVLCPPFTALSSVYEIIRDSKLRLGAQNLHWEKEGAYTGEVSAAMLRAAGCEFVIIGHSERRQYFGETDETINKKVRRAIAAGLIPILCVGETLEERERGQTEAVVEKQIRSCFAEVKPHELERCILAYEPVWAIGTGRNATPEQAEEVHQFIRRLIAAMYDGNVAEGLRIQYGGSVKPDNAKGLLSQPNIDGALVGGASLVAEAFTEIVKSA